MGPLCCVCVPGGPTRRAATAPDAGKARSDALGELPTYFDADIRETQINATALFQHDGVQARESVAGKGRGNLIQEISPVGYLQLPPVVEVGCLRLNYRPNLARGPSPNTRAPFVYPGRIGQPESFSWGVEARAITQGISHG
jgi:hypothetical protein